MSNLDWVLRQQEGQFFERKSCFDRSKGKLRPVRDVARDVAKTLAAMANADGGVLVVGIERYGGHNLSGILSHFSKPILIKYRIGQDFGGIEEE